VLERAMIEKKSDKRKKYRQQKAMIVENEEKQS
jgi:hypothetical protein